MANNLLISYDLHAPGRNYDDVTAAIKALSTSWAKVHYSLWYVQTSLSASDAAARVWDAMDANDSLFVVNATTNSAAWYNLTPEVSEYLKNNWAMRAAA